MEHDITKKESTKNCFWLLNKRVPFYYFSYNGYFFLRINVWVKDNYKDKVGFLFNYEGKEKI